MQVTIQLWGILDVGNVCNKNTFTVPNIIKHHKGPEASRAVKILGLLA
jgi:hypothetical protein